jgi:hypothetical protein
MAKVKLSGIVNSVAKNRIVNIWETFDIQGRQVYRKWTIWFDIANDIEKGDFIEVEGDLGTKIGSYEKEGETKQTIEHSINSPTLISHQPTSTQVGQFGYLSNDQVLDKFAHSDEAPF